MIRKGGTTDNIGNLAVSSTYLDSDGQTLNAYRYGWSFSVTQDGQDILLNYLVGNAIPEPSTMILAGLGLMGIIFRR